MLCPPKELATWCLSKYLWKGESRAKPTAKKPFNTPLARTVYVFQCPACRPCWWMKSVPRRSGLGWWMSSKVRAKKDLEKAEEKINNGDNNQQHQQTTNNSCLRAFLGHSRMRHRFTATIFLQRSKRSTRKAEGASARADTLHQLPHQHHDLIIFLGKHWDRYKSHQRRCHTQGIVF